jgi:predicted site-specific integrase-resolvase
MVCSSMDETDLIPLKDVPEVLKVSKVTLWKWIKEERISTVRLSTRKIYVRKKELERFIKEAETPVAGHRKKR